MSMWRKKIVKLWLSAMMLVSTVLGLTQVSALGNVVEIILEVDGFNAPYKNGIYINGTLVYTNAAAIAGYATLRVPIASGDLVNGVNTVTVTSGNETSPTGTAGNNDDFRVRDVRLKIAEGTIYQAETAKVFNANGTTVTTTPGKNDLIELGDGSPYVNSTAKEKAEFKFTLGTSKLVMEVDGFAGVYYNGVYMNGETLKVFHEPITGFTTVNVNVPNRLIKKGNNVITLTSGNDTSPTSTVGNNDDFNVRDVRLRLADNKVIPLTSVKVYNGNGTTTTSSPGPATNIFLGDGSPPDEQTSKYKADFTFNLVDYEFTFAMLPDTQNYTRNGNDAIFGEQTKWIVDKQEEKNIKYVLSVGDIVNNWDILAQWDIADAAYQKLDNNNIPYGVVAGNHDVNFTNGNYSNFGTYFGSARYTGKSWYGGQQENNRDHYDLVSAGGKDFIIVYLGWLIDQQTYDWANSVLAQYPNRNAIIATHEYISPSGAYSGQGQSIWNNVVSANSNVFLVVCGHINGAMYNVKTNGTQQVVELLADYQAEPEGGAGYMKLLHFNTTTNQMIIDSYSPHTEDYSYFSNESETRINVTLQ